MSLSPLEVIQAELARISVQPRITSPLERGHRLDEAQSYFYTLTTNHCNGLCKELDLNLQMPDYGGFTVETQRRIISKLTDEQPNRFGQVLRDAIKDKKFIDLACGNPNISFMPRFIAQCFDAKEYIGVDIQSVENSTANGEFNIGKSNNFKASTIQKDILPFLSDAQDLKTGSNCFYISGLEHNIIADRDHRYASYGDLCMRKISELSAKGDIVIIGPRTTGFEPGKYGFKCIYGDKSPTTHTIYEKI